MACPGKGSFTLLLDGVVKVVPDITSPKWVDVVTGRRALPTTSLGLQLLLERVKSKVTPATPAEEIAAAAAEIHRFFVKYERVLRKEMASITQDERSV